MKFLLVALIVLPFSAFSDVVGTWAWNAAGCRDSALSVDSHISRPKSDGRTGLKASVLKLNSDGSASMVIEFSDTTKNNETGSYRVENNKVIIMDPKVSDTEPALVLHIVGDELLINEAEIEGQSNTACRDGYYFVYVFGKV